MPTIIIGEIAHDPDAWMIHFGDGGDALGGAQPENRHLHRIRYGIPIEGDHLEPVTWQCEAANLRGTSNSAYFAGADVARTRQQFVNKNRLL